MDVGNYISELLAQKGEVSVPGLGYFAHTRVNGYYNEREGKFYPPTYSVQFDPQLIDDDTLAQYMADRKRISVASAKYFTEKYINSLKQLAQTEEAALADLGWFYLEQGRLFFSPNNEQSIASGSIGYEPLALSRLDGSTKVERSFAPTPEPTPETVPVSTLYTEPETFAVAPDEYPDSKKGLRFETDEEHEAYLEERALARRSRGKWIFTICIVVFFALAVVLVYRYDPNIFDSGSSKTKTVTEQPEPSTDTVINARVEKVAAEDTTPSAPDTGKAAAQPVTQTEAPKQADTPVTKPIEQVANNTPAVKETIVGPRYEIMGGSFKDDKEANTAIGNYKKLGIEAHIVTDAPGKRKKVSLGTFKKRAEAEEARKALVANKKVNKDIYTLEIKPKL